MLRTLSRSLFAVDWVEGEGEQYRYRSPRYRVGRLLLDANPPGNEVRFAVREIERLGATKRVGAIDILPVQLVGAVGDRGAKKSAGQRPFGDGLGRESFAMHGLDRVDSVRERVWIVHDFLGRSHDVLNVFRLDQHVVAIAEAG